MSLFRSISVLGIVLSVFAVGCSSAEDDSADKLTLQGRIGGGQASTQAWGNVSIGNGSVQVTARELTKSGTRGRKVGVSVASDGFFRLDVARGARWIITVDGSDQNSAMVTFGDGENVLAVKSGEGIASVDVGNVHITGGEAHSDIVIDGKLGLQSTLAELDEVFEDASGAVKKALEAAEDARQAAEDARKAAEDARAAAEAARKAAEDARNGL
jgi:hypothetical protein